MLNASGIVPRHLTLHLPGRSGESQVVDIAQLLSNRALRKFGWDAKVTQGSGDQGIDVIGKINSVSVAIQCKRYAGSVGNKAVQEAVAGMNFYGCDRAVVISTGKYTKSARELAKVTKVHLLSEYDLPEMKRILKL